jgi:competence protein ComGC
VLVADWRPTPRQVLWAIRIAIVVTFTLIALLLILYLIGLLFGITVWNLLKVLAVRIAIGAAVPLLNWLQKKRELDVENQRAQDSALEAYEDKMDRLILDRGLRTSERGCDSREVARLHTLSVLRRLGPNRKRHVVKFLWERNLIRYKRQETAEGLIQEDPPIVSLYGADLTDAFLSRMDLRLTNLFGARLVGADLSGSGLSAMQGSGEDLDSIREPSRDG